ncbi:MAG: hypothetical protein ABI651_16015 [Verrucomicrobiota bacterium]
MKFIARMSTFALVIGLVFGQSLETRAKETFRFRGYYITFMRMPTMGLTARKQTVDCVQADGGNTLLLWMGGAFRSKKFPVTWHYNREHKNVERDFARELIDYAHTKKIKVLLAFTPFAYDGVNQYPIEHPELKAIQRNGSTAQFWGMHSWGHNLCPSKHASQQFLLEYAREMFFEFYPNADGLMIESSDYAICFCADCKERFFDREFKFVKQISEEVWQRKPDAKIVVYPHYFSGRKVPGFDVAAAKQPFDPRWTLFFTPHSAHIDPELVQQSKTSIYWEDSPTRGTPAGIREAARKAQQFKITGFIPSLEAYSFVMEHSEGGEAHLVGKRLKPFGFEWLADGQMPFNELLVRVNRIAYREFTRNPDLPDAEFEKILGAETLSSPSDPQAIDDLLFVQESVFLDRSWWSASPLLVPDFLKARATREKVVERTTRRLSQAARTPSRN